MKISAAMTFEVIGERGLAFYPTVEVEIRKEAMPDVTQFLLETIESELLKMFGEKWEELEESGMSVEDVWELLEKHASFRFSLMLQDVVVPWVGTHPDDGLVMHDRGWWCDEEITEADEERFNQAFERSRTVRDLLKNANAVFRKARAIFPRHFNLVITSIRDGIEELRRKRLLKL
jgi:hypothetical protein